MPRDATVKSAENIRRDSKMCGVKESERVKHQRAPCSPPGAPCPKTKAVRACDETSISIWSWPLIRLHSVGGSRLHTKPVERREDRPRQTLRIAAPSIVRYFDCGSAAKAWTIQGMITSLNMTGSGQTPFCLPRCPPCGFIQPVLGTSPALSNR